MEKITEEDGLSSECSILVDGHVEVLDAIQRVFDFTRKGVLTLTLTAIHRLDQNEAFARHAIERLFLEYGVGPNKDR